MSFSSVVKDARLRRHPDAWTAAHLHERLNAAPIERGMTPKTLSLIERGEANPTWGTVSGIADALGVSMADLAKLADGKKCDQNVTTTLRNAPESPGASRNADSTHSRTIGSAIGKTRPRPERRGTRSSRLESTAC